jgi:hypothetical protein
LAVENDAIAFWLSRMPARARNTPIRLTHLPQLAKDIRNAPASTVATKAALAWREEIAHIEHGFIFGTAIPCTCAVCAAQRSKMDRSTVATAHREGRGLYPRYGSRPTSVEFGAEATLPASLAEAIRASLTPDK